RWPDLCGAFVPVALICMPIWEAPYLIGRRPPAPPVARGSVGGPPPDGAPGGAVGCATNRGLPDRRSPTVFPRPGLVSYSSTTSMRLSNLLIATLREDPADAEIPSHKLLARGGFIVKIAGGVYTYAPLMWRVVRKFAQIVREELDREGANEVMLPIIQPKELWVSSGRWERYVTDGIMFTLKDRKQSEMCLGPTHEEVMTAFVDAQVNSYKQLPINCYQIQDKFRDEIRPRFGLMRGREFIMMDAYSFDADQAGLDQAYQKMRNAYCRIFERCGLKYTVVQADSGAIGGSGSEEFMVVADSGEDSILFSACGYAANVEKAQSRLPDAAPGGANKAMEKRRTPNVT